MIDKAGLDQILHVVAKRWVDLTRDPNHKAVQDLPTKFWMNSVGGSAGVGKWITVLMYTENEQDANAFREVLLRWQSKGLQQNSTPDLIQIKKQ